MNARINMNRSGAGFFFFICLLCAPLTASAVNLAAVESTWTPPDGAPAVRMWSFIEDRGYCPAGAIPWEAAPVLTGAVNGTLSVGLRNCLAEKVSLLIPGLESTLVPQTVVDAQGRTRVRAFTKEVPADNGAALVTYTWNALRAGTFLYHSGSHPAKQVHMGLFGALTVGMHQEARNQALFLFSEIDPALHANAEAATPLNYRPKYYLINGQSAAPDSPPPATAGGKADQNLHLRFVNAGLMTHVPTLQGPYMRIFAEDGNAYPYAKEQYSVMLAAGKTMDALWLPSDRQSYPLYDRSLSMTTNGRTGGGMVTALNVHGFPWMLIVPAVTH